MKFSEMPYTRPDLEQVRTYSRSVLERIRSAASAQEQIDALKEYDQWAKELNTNCSLAYTRHTIDTRDPFYAAENDYVDAISPELQELSQRIDLALLHSPFRPELEESLGKLFFTNLEIGVR